MESIDSIGWIGIIINVVLMIIVGKYLLSWFKNSGASLTTPSLVLRKFDLDESTLKVFIEGRPGGLIDWLLTILGFQSTTTFRADSARICLETASLWGIRQMIIATPRISSIQCGFRKPIGFLILGVATMLISILQVFITDSATTMLICWVCAAFFFAVYVLAKTFEISLETQGGSTIFIKFQRSIIDNVSVDIEKAKVAVRILSGAITQTAEPVDAIQESTSLHKCKQCGTIFKAETMGKYCEHCGGVLS